jgi:excisionase family DNA binding protein
VTIDRHTPVSDLPELLRPEEAAAWLDCGKGTIYERARKQPDFAVRIGRLLRVRRTALAAMAGRDGVSA